MVDLGTLGGLTQVTAVNNSGQVIGYSRIPAIRARHAFLWTATSGMVDLGTFGGTQQLRDGRSTAAVTLSAAAFAPDELNHAFLWTPTDGMVDLGAGVAYAVNDHGQVVGVGPIGERPSRGHVDANRRDGGPRDAGRHKQLRLGRERARPSRGPEPNRSETRLFVRSSWTASDGMVDLAPLPGYTDSEAFFVNNSGQVVGISCNESCEMCTRRCGGSPLRGDLDTADAAPAGDHCGGRDQSGRCHGHVYGVGH